MKGRCRIWGCTDERGCPAGCGWVGPDLCSICSAFMETIADYIEASWHVSAAKRGARA